MTLEEEVYELIKDTTYYKQRLANRKSGHVDKSFSIATFTDLLQEIEVQTLDRPTSAAKRLEELYYVSKAFYPRFPELVDDIISRSLRNRLKGV